jgi:type VII secretion protein EccB
VQTRRDQLQAYRFQNRRALAALVTGEPNVLEPPMRRLTATTVSGIMIAILIAVGFALVGVFKPTTGKAWKDAGAVIIDRDTGATYIYAQDVLHPVANYTSAVLAAGTNQAAHVVQVDRSDLDGTPRGVEIGIPGLPASLPPASGLVSSPVTSCSRLQGTSGTTLHARVSLRIGDTGQSHALPSPGAGVLVRTPSGASYLLGRGHRLTITSPNVALALGLQNTSPLTVGTAFVESVPPGPDLRAPAIAVGGQSDYAVNGTHPLIGQLLHISGTDQYQVVLPDGLAAVTSVQTALLRTLPTGTPATPHNPIETPESGLFGTHPSTVVWPRIQQSLAGLPDQLQPDAIAANTRTVDAAGGLCAVYGKGSEEPAFTAAPNSLPSVVFGGVDESVDSQHGQADSVTVPAGSVALVRSTDSATLFLVAEPGTKYPAASKDAINALGYGSATPSTLPVQVLPLIPSGKSLDPVAARRPVSN